MNIEVILKDDNEQNSNKGHKMTNLKTQINAALKMVVTSSAKLDVALEDNMSQEIYQSRLVLYRKSILRIETLVETMVSLQEDMEFVSFQKEIDAIVDFLNDKNIEHQIEA